MIGVQKTIYNGKQSSLHLEWFEEFISKAITVKKFSSINTRCAHLNEEVVKDMKAHMLQFLSFQVRVRLEFRAGLFPVI